MILEFRSLKWSMSGTNKLDQADFYSGGKGHGNCVQYGNITNLRGYCWCVVPGMDIGQIVKEDDI